MDVSIVISTYNRCGLLEGALGALLSQTPADAAYEILVVDNNSTDQTRSVVQGLAMQNQEKLKYLFEPKQGLSYGRNAGIAAAKAPIIAFTDDDVRVAADWVWRVKGSFEANPDIDFLGEGGPAMASGATAVADEGELVASSIARLRRAPFLCGLREPALLDRRQLRIPAAGFRQGRAV